MKPKKFNKKLVLNKSTVADLGDAQMNRVNGGGTKNCNPESYLDPISCAETCGCTEGIYTCPVVTCPFVCV